MASTVFPAPSASVATGSQTFNSSSTWTAPSGVTKVNYILAAGGGGGGASANATTNGNYNFCAGGGAGGEVARGSMTVVPGTTYAITVGAGGAGAVATTSSSTFGTSQPGGYSSIGFTYSLENAIINGAGENNSVGWFGGAANFLGTGNAPTWTSTYSAWDNSSPANNNTSYATSTSLNTVTNVSSGTTTPYLYNTNSANPGGTDYNDLMIWVPVTGSTSYVASGYVGNQQQTTQAYSGIRIDWFTSYASGLISSNTGTLAYTTSGSQTDWQRRTLTTTSPSNATWALIRFMNWDYKVRWTGLQLEVGSSVTDYIGPNVTGYKTISGLGVVSVTAGAVAVGGGGGNGTLTGNTVTGNGFGGGAASGYAGAWHIAGHGSGYGGTAGAPTIFATSSSLPYIDGYQSVANGSGNISSGSNVYRINSTNQGYLIQPNGPSASPEGYGAGGMGAYANSTIAGKPGVGAGQPVSPNNNGNSAVANTGAGGGGAQSGTAAANSTRNGGNGGSGAVVLTW